MHTDNNLTLRYFFKQIANGVFFSFFFTFIFLILIAGVIFFTSFSFSDVMLRYILWAVHFFSVFLGAFVVGHWLKNRGLFLGFLIGFIYTLIAALLGLTCNESALGIIAFFNHILFGVFAGALGGILGVNL